MSAQTPSKSEALQTIAGTAHELSELLNLAGEAVHRTDSALAQVIYAGARISVGIREVAAAALRAD